MQLALILVTIFATFEMLLYVPFIWKYRQKLSQFLIYPVALSSIFLLIAWFNIGTILILALSIYRAVNLSRIIKHRLQAGYLYNSARRASYWLILGQLILFGYSYYTKMGHLNVKTWLAILACCQLFVSAAMLITLSRNMKSIRQNTGEQDPQNTVELPSLSVLIPARNETVQLENCLTSLIASSYPKLEIVVLDDCSQNKSTPGIIRSFAQSGVRFIAGEEPPESWLAKNYAYKQLEEQSYGELMLFCGVDASFEPHSLTNIVQALITGQRDMLSILPLNTLPHEASLKTILIQPLRYAWELILPRATLSRPPVLSTCWLIRRQALKAFGGFGAVSRKITPESYFARQTAYGGNGYCFIESDSSLSVSSLKDFIEQRSTALRTRYPQLHRRIEFAALLSLTEFLIFIWPVIGFIIGFCISSPLLIIVSLGGLIFTSIINIQITSLTYRRFMLNSLWFLPVAIVYDIGILNYSMWQYEFSEVLWKGRNVCIPVMRLLPKPTPNLNWEQKR
jgi:hypothetical protein